MPIRLLDRGELKREAKDLIRTAHVSPIRFTLFFFAIAIVLDLIDSALTNITNTGVSVAFLTVSFISILISLIAQVLSAGYLCYCLGVHRREEMPYESLFDGFAFAGKVILLVVLEGIFVFLWSLCFVIPGIIALYRYSFAMWNLCADPSIGALEALRRSKQQTRGYKWQLFVLQLSFIGWFILVGVVASIYESLAVRFLPGTLAGVMIGAVLYGVLTAAAEAYFKPYYTLSVCGFYLRATADRDAGGTQERSGYDPEF